MAPPGRLSKAGTSTSPNSTNPPKPPKPNTRSTQTVQPTLADMVNSLDQEIQDAETGTKFLVEKGFIESDEPVTPNTLSDALLRASQYRGLPVIPRSALKAAAFIIRDLALTAQSNDLVTKVASSLEKTVISAISPHVAKIYDASARLDRLDASLIETREKIEDSAKAITSQQSPTTTSTQQQKDAEVTTHSSITGELEAIKASIAELKDHVSANANANTPPPLPSSPYRNALISQPSTTPTADTTRTNDQARANAARKERQLLVDIDLNHPVSNSIMSRTELISLFQKAIVEIKDDDAPDITIKSLAILRNGGILLEFPSKQAVQWIKQSDRLQRLAAASGGNLAFKDRSYNIVVPFVPTTTTIESPETLKAIEEENELPRGAIGTAKWIKPPQRREAAQRVAHALFRMTTPEAANQLISKGMYVNLERLRPTKDKKEPLRCLKCQRWGHMARDCGENHDTCGTCAKNHRTNACPSYSTPHCVSCDSNSHASWNRTCPEFKRRSRALDETTPENCMPYFPTEEVWTQALLPPRSSGHLAPTCPPNPMRKPPAANQSTQRLLTGYARPQPAARASTHPPPPPDQPQRPTHSPSTQPNGEPAGPPTPTPTPTTATTSTEPSAPMPTPTPAPTSTSTTTPLNNQHADEDSNRPSTPRSGQPAPFPPISPLDNPPPMPTPPAFMTNPTQEDPTDSTSRDSHV